MKITDQFILISHSLFSSWNPAPSVDTCDLLSTLPEPLKSLEGNCITISSCSNYASPGFCHGAADIQCCTTSFAGDNGPSTGDLSAFGLGLIEAFEGFVDNFYCDLARSTTYGHRHCLPGEGHLTIGWGHLCNPEPNCDFINDSDLPISQAFGDDLLRQDAKKFVDAVNAKITAVITQNQFDALVSFIFNCGPAWLNSVGPLINSGDLAGASERMKDCNTAGGVPNANLKMRRGIEVNVFNSPGFDARN